MITRRGFFGLFGGALAAEAARKIYVLPPAGGWRFAGGVITPGETLFYLSPEHWKYRYAYRNDITGCVSDATPDIARMVHTFAYPERYVMDIYKELHDGNFEWYRTVEGFKG